MRRVHRYRFHERWPAGFRAGDNANAFLGGFRAWEDETAKQGQGRPERLRQRMTRETQEDADDERRYRASRPAARVGGAPCPPPGDRVAPSAQTLRGRSGAGRTPRARGRWRLPRLLQESHHRRDASSCSFSLRSSRAYASASTRCSAATRSTSRSGAPCCMSRSGRRATPRSSSTARTLCRRSMPFSIG